MSLQGLGEISLYSWHFLWKPLYIISISLLHMQQILVYRHDHTNYEQ